MVETIKISSKYNTYHLKAGTPTLSYNLVIVLCTNMPEAISVCLT
jgi:hypothetical protein